MVVVRGSLDNLQSDIDFFLSITSKDIEQDSKSLRDRFFEMFKQEDLQRKENFLLYQERVSDDYAIVDNAEPLLVGEEVEYSFGDYSFAEVEEEYPDDSEVYTSDSSPLEMENINLEIEDDYESISYSSLDIEKNNLEEEKDELLIEETNLDIEKNNLEEENYDLDDDEFINQSYSEIENINLETENNISFSENFEEEEYKEEPLQWGNYEEDEEVEENPFSNIDFSSFGNVKEVEEEETFSWGNYEEEEEEILQEDEVIPNIPVTQEIKEVINSNDKEQDDISSFFGDLGEFDSSFNIEEKEVEEVKNEVSDVKRDIVEEAIEVPKDLRDFVKMYHNCEMSFALKYFSKKEIDKQLSLGRIFKRKNRLLI